MSLASLLSISTENKKVCADNGRHKRDDVRMQAHEPHFLREGITKFQSTLYRRSAMNLVIGLD